MSETYKPLGKKEIAFIAGIGLFLLLNVFGLLKTIPSTTIDTAILLTFVGGWRIFQESLSELLVRRRIGSDFAVSIAAIAALLIGEYLAAAEVIFIMLIGGALEHYAVAKTHSAIEKLTQLAPQTALIRRDGQEIEVPIEEVEVGDLIIVRPGERIPVDGIIRFGRSSVNQSSLTGESIPIEKSVGDEAFTGTINEFGSLEVEATKVGSDTALAQIIQLVEKAQGRKGSVQRLADRFAAWFVPAVLLAGVATFLMGRLLLGVEAQQTWIRTVSVLIVACPCAMVLATPTAIVAAIGRLARIGVLVKGGIFLEQLAAVNCVAFDKTGTLTEGQPQLQEIIAFGNRAPESLLSLAASAEQASEHPLARAIVAAAKSRQIPLSQPEEFQTSPGLGLKAKVNGQDITVGSLAFLKEQLKIEEVDPEVENQLQALSQNAYTIVVVAEGKAIAGLIGVSDPIRPEASSMTKSLKAAGIQRLVLLSGDDSTVVQRVSRQLHIDEAQAGLRPYQKVEKVVSLQHQGYKVAMVGDGINDAPVLAAADVGIGLGGIGTDIAIEAADMVLINDDLSKLPEAIAVSRQTLKTIKQNLVWFALSFNLVAVFAAAIGKLSPIEAAVAHQVASLLVVVNSLRLLAYGTYRTFVPTQKWRHIIHNLSSQWQPSKLKTWLYRRHRGLIAVSAFGISLIWLASGIFIIDADEVGVVRRFGKLVSENLQSGLHYRLPSPISKLSRVKKWRFQSVEIGFRTLSSSQQRDEPATYEWNFQHRFGRYQRIPEESVMVTGDENLVSINMTVHYTISDVSKYLFSAASLENLVRLTSESVLQNVMSKSTLDEVLVAGRNRIEKETLSQLQNHLGRYGTGVLVRSVKLQDVHPPLEVVDAFRDVSSAFEEKQAMVNEAESYRNELIPLSRGEAASQIQQAEAYKGRSVLYADGESHRFSRMSSARRRYAEVTRTRLHLETIEQVLKDKPKVILDNRKAGRQQLLFVDEGSLSPNLLKALQALSESGQKKKGETITHENESQLEVKSLGRRDIP